VRPARFGPKDFAIGHVTQPRQRMPVTNATVRRRPDNPFPCQTAHHHGVFVHIIIEIDKPEARLLAKNGKGNREQQKNTRPEYASPQSLENDLCPCARSFFLLIQGQFGWAGNILKSHHLTALPREPVQLILLEFKEWFKLSR
jgi:hypothetical protein